MDIVDKINDSSVIFLGYLGCCIRVDFSPPRKYIGDTALTPALHLPATSKSTYQKSI